MNRDDEQNDGLADALQQLFWEANGICASLGGVQKVWAERLSITVPQWNILMAIASLGDNGVPVNLVSKLLVVDGSFVTAQSKLLEARNLICRRQSVLDRRVVLLALSIKARQEIAELSDRQKAVGLFVCQNLRGRASQLRRELAELREILRQAELMVASRVL